MYGNNYYQPYNNNTMPNYMSQGSPYYSPPQTQMNTATTAPVNTNKIFVNGIEDVKTRYLPANSEYYFLDNDKPLLYEKKVDATGKMELHMYDITPHTPEADKPETKVDMSLYVLKADFETLQKELAELKHILNKRGNRDGESTKQQ